MKRLRQYLAESERTHEYRLKTIQELTDEQLDKLEKHLRKYDVFQIDTPKRTILQSAPLDFYNTGASEVYIIDFKTKIPLSPAVLIDELVAKLNVSERNMRVRNLNEPGEQIDTEHREADKDENGKTIPLLSDSKYSEAEKIKADDYYGEKFKSKFLKELERTRVEMPVEYKIKNK
jgi:curved DNA-binding protein CbpA